MSTRQDVPHAPPHCGGRKTRFHPWKAAAIFVPAFVMVNALGLMLSLEIRVKTAAAQTETDKTAGQSLRHQLSQDGSVRIKLPLALPGFVDNEASLTTGAQNAAPRGVTTPDEVSGSVRARIPWGSQDWSFDRKSVPGWASIPLSTGAVPRSSESVSTRPVLIESVPEASPRVPVQVAPLPATPPPTPIPTSAETPESSGEIGSNKDPDGGDQSNIGSRYRVVFPNRSIAAASSEPDHQKLSHVTPPLSHQSLFNGLPKLSLLDPWVPARPQPPNSASRERAPVQLVDRDRHPEAIAFPTDSGEAVQSVKASQARKPLNPVDPVLPAPKLAQTAAEQAEDIHATNKSTGLMGPATPLALPYRNTETAVAVPRRSGEVTIAAVGDVMTGRAVRKAGLRTTVAPGTAQPLHPILARVIKSADVAVASLEGVIGPADLKPRGCVSRACYRFLMPVHTARHLRAVGFDFISLATNHIRDFGAVGMEETTMHLLDAGMKVAGIDRAGQSFTRMRVGALTVGFIAFAPNQCCLDIREIDTARSLVSDVARRFDLTIVAFHGGAEGSKHQRVPRRIERYVGENRGDVFAFSRAVIEAGADLVLGSGPHVPRAIEVHQDRLIAYSLGNFWTPHDFALGGVSGLAPILVARLAEDGALLDFEIVSAKQAKGVGPIPDGEAQAAERIKELTMVDFPEKASPFQVYSSSKVAL
ncbi:MAG: CapA family protein, partial [Pseudomonadota bacterium]